MKISKLKNAPRWLVKANTCDADVSLEDSRVTWHDGVWYSGAWHGGVWCGGMWIEGVWHGGEWRGGAWHGGEWWGGAWHGGVWHGGVWHEGAWHGGEWHGGAWHGGEWWGGKWWGGAWHGGAWWGGAWYGGKWYGPENRLLFMASLIGIEFDGDGWATAYRTISADGAEGKYYEDEAAPAGAGTCAKGIYITSAGRAWAYFGVDPSCKFVRVRFKREDLLDCDGEKARIRGGIFEFVERPF